MMKRLAILAVVAMCMLLAGAGNAVAAITGTYVDADSANTVSVSGGAWYTGADADDNLWRLAAGVPWSIPSQGGSAPEQLNGTWHQSNGYTADDCPELVTSTPALAPGTYKMRVYFWLSSYNDYMDSGNNNMAINAGLSADSLTVYDHVNGTYTGYNAQPFSNYFELWEAVVGQVTISSPSTISVYVDDLKTSSSYQPGSPGMYEGISYEVVAAAVSGQITLQDYSGDLSLTPIKVELIQSGSVVRTEMVTLTSNPGQYTIGNVAPGTYDVAFSAASWLHKVVTGKVVTAGETNTVDAPLIRGDLDGDNVVTTTDVSVLLRNIDQVGN